MFKKIMEKIIRKKNQTEEKTGNICWPCDWNCEQIQNFNAMLYGMALEKIQ